MPALLALDIAALGLSTLLSATLAVAVGAAGLRKPLNRSFCGFVLFAGAHCAFALLLRLSLFYHAGNPELLLQLAAACLFIMIPFLFLFVARYLKLGKGWPLAVASAALALLAALGPFLFSGKIVYHPWLETSGIANDSDVNMLNGRLAVRSGFIMVPAGAPSPSLPRLRGRGRGAARKKGQARRWRALQSQTMRSCPGCCCAAGCGSLPGASAAIRSLRWPLTPFKADRLLIAPQDLRTADATRATEIYSGRFAFAGKVVVCDGRSIFEMEPPSDEWAAALLGFGWLRHLRAADSQSPAPMLARWWMNGSRCKARGIPSPGARTCCRGASSPGSARRLSCCRTRMCASIGASCAAWCVRCAICATPPAMHAAAWRVCRP